MKKKEFCFQNKILNEKEFKKYIEEILDGQFSLYGNKDYILVEEKIIPGNGFEKFCEYGLADIRVIVFNLVPVAAMVRVPTKDSQGKANIAQGGIGVGIDIGDGKTYSLFQNKKLYLKNFSKENENFIKNNISFWDDILLYSSKVQYFLNLGYLALDWVITQDGPKILEINARAGLEIQNVCNIKLKKRLEKIQDKKIESVENGVEISKVLFGRKSNTFINKKILNLSQNAIFKTDNIEENILLKINIENEKNYCSSNILDILKQEKFLNKIMFEDIILSDLEFIGDEKLTDNEIILGKEAIKNFYINPEEKGINFLNVIKKDCIFKYEEIILKEIDSNILNINKKLYLNYYLKPINYFEELNNFLENKEFYNPKFVYNKIKDKEVLLNNINKTKELLNDVIKSKIKYLFQEKLEELDYKYNLILSYENEDFVNIKKYNELLFGKIEEEKYTLSEEKIKDNNEGIINLGKKLSIQNVEKIIKNYLLDKGFDFVEIVISDENLARISIKFGSKIKLFLSTKADFYEKEILSILAHEVDTHLLRYVNGQKTYWNILKIGTGFYLQDEEGLAMYNSSQIFSDTHEKTSMYKKYYLLKEINNKDFKESFEIVKNLYKDKNFEYIFNTVLRMKKGIMNTSLKFDGNVFLKDKIYLDGHFKISNLKKSGKNTDKMYIGKVKYEDLDYFNF